MASEAAKHDLSVLEQMPSLGESATDIKDRVAKQMEAAKGDPKEKEKTKQRDKRKDPVYTFEFKHTDGNGKIWKGSFRNTRLTIKDQRMVGIMQAQMAANTPYAALDPLTAEINMMLAHMAVSLSPEIRPDWAKELEALDNVQLLQALYAEVAQHEAIFHGLQPGEGSSKNDSQ